MSHRNRLTRPPVHRIAFAFSLLLFSLTATLTGCDDQKPLVHTASPAETPHTAATTSDTGGTPILPEATSYQPLPEPEPPQVFERGTKGLVANCSTDVWVCNDSLVSIKSPSGVEVGGRVRAFNSQCYIPDGSVVEVVVHDEDDVLVHVHSTPKMGPKELGDVSISDLCPSSANAQRVLLLISSGGFTTLASNFVEAEKEAAAKREQDAVERKRINALLDMEKKVRKQ